MAELINPAGNLISHPIGRRGGQQVVQPLHAGAEAAALVQINPYQDLVSRLYLLCHLFIWKKQILFEPPVQESPDPAHLLNRQHSRLSQKNPRCACGGDGAVFGIPVDKYFHLIARRRPLGDLLRREQYHIPVALPRCQIDSEVCLPDHSQSLFFAYSHHALTSYTPRWRKSLPPDPGAPPASRRAAATSRR